MNIRKKILAMLLMAGLLTPFSSSASAEWFRPSEIKEYAWHIAGGSVFLMALWKIYAKWTLCNMLYVTIKRNVFDRILEDNGNPNAQIEHCSEVIANAQALKDKTLENLVQNFYDARRKNQPEQKNSSFNQIKNHLLS